MCYSPPVLAVLLAPQCPIEVQHFLALYQLQRLAGDVDLEPLFTPVVPAIASAFAETGWLQPRAELSLSICGLSPPQCVAWLGAEGRSFERPEPSTDSSHKSHLPATRLLPLHRVRLGSPLSSVAEC